MLAGRERIRQNPCSLALALQRFGTEGLPLFSEN
jgi:hypothetical protein